MEMLANTTSAINADTEEMNETKKQTKARLAAAN